MTPFGMDATDGVFLKQKASQMKTVIVAKAEGIEIYGAGDFTIEISGSIPNFGEDWVEQSMEFFEEQASLIVDALQTHLPGGTLDAVLRELCKRKACLFRVPIGGKP